MTTRRWIPLGSTVLAAIPPWEATVLAQTAVRTGDEIRIRLQWRGGTAGILVEIETRTTAIGDVPSADPDDKNG